MMHFLCIDNYKGMQKPIICMMIILIVNNLLNKQLSDFFEVTFLILLVGNCFPLRSVYFCMY